MIKKILNNFSNFIKKRIKEKKVSLKSYDFLIIL